MFDLISDIHLEHGTTLSNKFKTQSSVLVVAGDVSEFTNRETMGVPFLRQMRQRYKHVVFVLGNHEFYGTDHTQCIAWWKDQVDALRSESIHVLINDVVVIDGNTFVGSTLWSNVYEDRFGCSSAILAASINDYRLIKDFTLTVALRYHLEAVSFLNETIPKHPGCIVVTHHLPSFRCIARQYKGSPINGAFASDLDETLLRKHIGLWVHGHTHAPIDVNVHGVRIVCWPVGYADERRTNRPLTVKTSVVLST